MRFQMIQVSLADSLAILETSGGQDLGTFWNLGGLMNEWETNFAKNCILGTPQPGLGVLLTQGTHTRFVPCTIPNIFVQNSLEQFLLYEKLFFSQKWSIGI